MLEPYDIDPHDLALFKEKKSLESLDEAEKEQYERNRRFYNKTKRVLKSQPEFQGLFQEVRRKGAVAKAT